MYGILINGAGWVARQHATAYRNHRDCRIVAINNRSKPHAVRLVEELGLDDVAIYTDFASALNHSGVDIVSICTPQHLHCENVLQAAAAGKHLVIEKPVATNRDDLYRMRDAINKSGVKTVVGFVLRWNPLVVLLKKMLADGIFGEPYYVEVDYMSYNGSWWSGWNEGRTLTDGVSASLVAGCHAVDVARWLACVEQNSAATPNHVYAIAGGLRKGTDREFNPINNSWIDNVPPMEYNGLEIIITEFTNGVKAKVCVNAECIMPYRFPIRIFGTKGTAIDNKIWSTFFPKQNDWITIPTILPDSSDVSHHPFQGEINHFIDDCVSKNKESHCSFTDTVATHEIVFDAIECYQKDK
ncbi:MAG: Gfo/Idh/MocA family oxidoreductase [Planctomycetaceae bacterium]|jgi:predicted dehydrogenase|nr:Gfo/Idh/MocA family oxidoreductase [Planctomycetaceae bacterium]